MEPAFQTTLFASDAFSYAEPRKVKLGRRSLVPVGGVAHDAGAPLKVTLGDITALTPQVDAGSDTDESVAPPASSPLDLAVEAADPCKLSLSHTGSIVGRRVWNLVEASNKAPTATTEKAPTAARTPLRCHASAFVPTAPKAAAMEYTNPWLGLQQSQGVPQQAADEGHTTVMMCRVPLSYSRDRLIDLMDSHGFAKKFDFVYLPTNFTTMLGVGYAFVNMTTHEQAKEFVRVFDGFTDWDSIGSRACMVRWSKVQGLATNTQRFRNSPVMSVSVPNSYKPVLLKDGVRIPFPEPTKTLRAERKIASKCKMAQANIEDQDDFEM
jgi:hypothetical protein